MKVCLDVVYKTVDSEWKDESKRVCVRILFGLSVRVCVVCVGGTDH